MDINLFDIDFALLLAHAGMSVKDATVFLGKSERTIRRYISEGAPPMAIRALEFRAGIAPGWHRFYFRKDHLVTPANETVSAAELTHFNWTKSLYMTGRGIPDWHPNKPQVIENPEKVASPPKLYPKSRFA